jgi:hypothetical protein
MISKRVAGSVIPALAGIQFHSKLFWIPAYAGMTWARNFMADMILQPIYLMFKNTSKV